MTILTVLLILVAVVVSYFFADPAIVWMLQEAHPRLKVLLLWIEWGGNHRREIAVVLGIVWVLMGIIQLWLLREKRTKNWLWVVVVVSLLVSFAYPFLSRDVFSYLFAGKMVECYGVNPYATLPKVFFEQDLWLRFTHWIDAKYVYGPMALFFSWLPVKIIGCQRFIVNFFAYKLFNWLIFVITGCVWWRKAKDKNLVLAAWFLNPFLLTEWLINGHNDLLMVSFWLLSWWGLKKSRWWSAVLYVVSIMTKYVSVGLFWMRWWPDRYL